MNVIVIPDFELVITSLSLVEYLLSHIQAKIEIVEIERLSENRVTIVRYLAVE